MGDSAVEEVQLQASFSSFLLCPVALPCSLLAWGVVSLVGLVSERRAMAWPFSGRSCRRSSLSFDLTATATVAPESAHLADYFEARSTPWQDIARADSCNGRCWSGSIIWVCKGGGRAGEWGHRSGPTCASFVFSPLAGHAASSKTRQTLDVSSCIGHASAGSLVAAAPPQQKQLRLGSPEGAGLDVESFRRSAILLAPWCAPSRGQLWSGHLPGATLEEQLRGRARGKRRSTNILPTTGA